MWNQLNQALHFGDSPGLCYAQVHGDSPHGNTERGFYQKYTAQGPSLARASLGLRDSTLMHQ